MKIDISKDGLDAVFTPWEKEAFQILTETPGKTWTSGTLHKELPSSISQASVYNFLEELAAFGFVSVEVGKGTRGSRNRYTVLYSLKGALNQFKALTINWANSLFDSSTDTVMGVVEE